MRLSRTALLLAITLLVATATSAAPTGKRYKTPEKAVDAFISALRTYSPAALKSIFGKDSERLFQSEDAVNDQNVRAIFLSLYDKKHELRKVDDTSQLLLVGEDGWPFPIPLVKSRRGWQFDTDAGIDEIVNRRVGRNELAAIQTVLAIGDAQRDYYSRDRDGDGILEYAQAFRSTVGLQNGLFWPASQGEPQSPLGEFVGYAADEGYTGASDSYHGYHYRLLKGQGAAAPGGAYDYLAHDDQIGGFAILAYPAAYGDSGIMTFILNHSGVVYQRDLGPNTSAEVEKITRFDPEGWTPVPQKDTQPLPQY